MREPHEPSLRSGSVVEFDAARGRGTVVGDDGERLGFHCTQIADGTRTIDVGATVRYRRVPAHLGTWEAAAVATTR